MTPIPVLLRVAAEQPERIASAYRDVESAAADFFIAIHVCQTVTEALRLQMALRELSSVLAAAESAALEKADQLCTPRGDV